MASTKILTFKVTRKNPELIPPREALPYEIKYLSNIDDQDSLRLHVPGIHFYRKNLSMEGKDPVKVIRDAIAKALVFYYPLAGRLRECTGRKLVVECTGEGMVFVEADADIMLHHFGDTLYPPFPNLDQLLPHIPAGSHGIINCPLLFFQLRKRTRLRNLDGSYQGCESRPRGAPDVKAGPGRAQDFENSKVSPGELEALRASFSGSSKLESESGGARGSECKSFGELQTRRRVRGSSRL
ncbi:HXXXD-type acyl-transferase family protein [Perilla frutescens var. frutescens]|nr:HXXXD-type acyl-transferase family protein [Perilla frutescens var. frutescens]